MQTVDYVDSLEQIVVNLKAREIVEFLEKIIISKNDIKIDEESKSNFSNLIFAVKEGHYSLNQNPNIKKILDITKITTIFESSKLGKILTAFNNSPNTTNIIGNPINYSMFSDLFYSMLSIILFQRAASKLLLEDKTGSVLKNESILKIELFDYDNTGIETTRVKKFLESIEKLHDHICRLLDDKESRLKIKFIDSGSDFLFAIQSTKTIIDIIKTLFEQYWTKIRFKTYNDFDHKIESLSKGLKVIDIIHDQIKRSIIDAETGRILKHSILDEITNLTGVGATLKEINIDEQIDKRQLLSSKKDIKLLGANSVPD